MKRFITTAVVSLLLMGGQAHAQTASAGASAGASSGSSSSSGSSASGGNVNITTTNNTAGTTRQEYGGSYEVKSAPGIAAPGLFNTAPCMVSYSGGLSVIGGGATFGGGTMDEDCNLRAEAAALVAVAGTSVGVRHLARDPEMCQTLRSAGNIPGNSLCTEAEKRQANRAATATTRLSSRSGTAPVTPDKLFRKCAVDGGTVKIVYTAAGRKNKPIANQACLATLGY